MFGALIDYWFYTGDSTFNDLVTKGLLFQASPSNNFMPPNQTASEGNDDQGFWAIAAMAAAERRFPDPPSDRPQWLALAQGVFNSQAARWDMDTCAGGLKWQIFALNNGYDYKNTISNGCFFNLAARLALFTRNETFAEWAEKTWDWVTRIGLISEDWQVYDGTNGDAKWGARVQGLLAGLHTFFVSETNVMHEVTCEYSNNCLVDQRSFKAYLARWLAATTQIAPFTAGEIMPKLQASAYAAAKACSGGQNGRMCGLRWTTGTHDGYDGIGEQMAALEVIQSNLVPLKEVPYTSYTGGTSKGDPTAGIGGGSKPALVDFSKITPADSTGAAILTAIVILGIVWGTYWTVQP
ncbi:hydrolase 76 protein [Ascosphaera pollenicola]|nr:hydrolase 76 protein [Ascosphaera pollenicola]